MVHPHDIYLTSEPWAVRITKIAHEFVKSGHEVKLVYFPLPQDRAFEKVENVPIKDYETIPMDRNRWKILENTLKLHKLTKWADIVHFQKCFPHAALPSLIAGYCSGKPVHYDWDDWEYQIYQFSPPSRIMGWYLYMIEQLLPKLVDTISVASRNLYDLSLKLGIDESRIFEAHIGADLEEFSPHHDGNMIRQKYGILGPIVLYLGQLHSGQYVDLFIDAARQLSWADACFLIVGGGYALDRYLHISKDLTDIGKVIFTGFLYRHEVAQYLAATDIAVACFEDNELTRSKSPLKIAEYMAAGKAIVASNVGEAERMLGGAGLLVKAGDSKALAEGIQRLLSDKKLRDELGKKARKRAEEKYNWRTPTKNLLKAYRLATIR